MVILLNPFAGGNRALKKWKRLEWETLTRVSETELFVLNRKIPLNDFIARKLREGQRHFIAAGGDGTVNLVLQSLLKQTNKKNLQDIKLGAIGLGSSNDFHKPFDPSRMIRSIPIKTDFNSADAQDVGVVLYEDTDGKTHRCYWINNASVGITAEANGFFNASDKILQVLKKYTTGLAIVYAALHTIFFYQNKEMEIRFGSGAPKTIKVSNLGVIKNPHFSGNFCYDSPYEKNSGYFYTHLCHGLSTGQTLKILWHLSHTEFSGLKNTITFRINRLGVRAKRPFTIEFDGETIGTRKAEFFIEKKLIKVCQK